MLEGTLEAKRHHGTAAGLLSSEQDRTTADQSHGTSARDSHCIDPHADLNAAKFSWT